MLLEKAVKGDERTFCYPYFCRKPCFLGTRPLYRIDRERILSDILLPSYDYEASCFPSTIFLTRRPEKRFFRFIQFLFNYPDSIIRCSPSFDFKADRENILSSLIKMRSRALKENKKQELITKGRKTPDRKKLINRFLKDKTVVEILEKGDYKANLREAKSIFKNMVADYSITYLQVFNKILTPLYAYLYDDIIVNKTGVENIRNIASEYPIIFIPNHKSHMDYLLLSYCMFKNDLICPLIAAGDNLNYFPIGTVFRRAGGFFIKRDFRGSLLYPQLFRHYLNYLIRSRSSIEFYIEGTRTRTGKLLSPKTGLLRLLIQGMREINQKDLYIVPVSIEYDRVIEDSVLVEEDLGIPKKKEDIEGLFDIHNFIKKHYKNVYINLSPAISVKSFLKEQAGDQEKRYTKKSFSLLSERIMEDLFSNMEISGSTLLSSVLFFETRWTSKPILKWRLNEVIDTITYYRKKDLMKRYGSLDSFIDRYISFFESQDFIIKSEKSGSLLYKVRSKKHNQILKYYFNNISELLLPRSFIAFIIKRHNVTNYEEIMEMLKNLAVIFRHSIKFRSIFLDESILRNVIENSYSENDLNAPCSSVIFWANLSAHLRLGYYYGISMIVKILSREEEIRQGDLIIRMIKLANLYNKLGIISHYNIISSAMFSNVIDMLIEEKVISISRNSDNQNERFLQINTENMNKTDGIKDSISLEYERDRDVLTNFDCL